MGTENAVSSVSGIGKELETDGIEELVFDSEEGKGDGSGLVALVLNLKQKVEDLERDRDRLLEKVKELKSQQKEGEKKRKKMARDISEIGPKTEENKSMAKKAVASSYQALEKVEKGEAAVEQENKETMGEGVESSSSPLDFFANIWEHRVKAHMVDQGIARRNRYRAVLVSKRWDEFATRRKDGSGIFWTEDDIKQALTAILGEKPHGTTVKRVWDELVALGGSDLEQNRRVVSAKKEPEKIIAMDIETADGLHDSRYHHLELIDKDGVAKGVTPVVMRQ